MRAVLFTAVALLVLFFMIQTHNNPQLRYNAWSARLMHPLDTRLRYRIAEVDPRFDMSREQVIQLSKQAIQIWHDGMQKPLFVYDDDAKLQIHLIYDQRQADYNALKKTQQALTHESQINERISSNLDISKSNLEQMRRSLQQEQIQLQADFNELNQQRMRWNSREDAQGEIRQHIESQYQALQDRARQLESNIAYFNQINSQYSQQVSQHNSSLDRFNWNVQQAQRRFPPREFHKGVFMGDQIQIYQFDAENDLRLTLAHELGHALGLGHHADPSALMYPVLGGQQLEGFKLMPADQTLLYYR